MKLRLWSGLAVLCLLCTGAASAEKFKGLDALLGVTPKATFAVHEIACSGVSNVFWPGDVPSFTLQVVNTTDTPLQAQGSAMTIQYGTSSDPLDGWTQIVHKIADCGAVPVALNIPAKGFVDITVKPVVPKRFGAYALVLDVPGHGRQFAAAFLNTPKATPGKVQFPTYALDLREVTPEMCGLWQRLGIKGTRNEWGFRQDEGSLKALDRDCKIMDQFEITCMLCIEGGDYSTMPLGTIRSFLDDKGVGKFEYPGDFAWEPKYDVQFQAWMKKITAQFGWPKGPVNAVELWNEPWEGLSISGWGADTPRYREMYEHMARGVVEAREQDKVQVLIGGTCSSMNTEDKLFCDGKDTFLKWLDFTSIHYQPLDNVPALIPSWVNRKSEFGAVQPWDTESWIANSEDKVAAVIASMRAQGLTRTAGVLHDVIREPVNYDMRTADGKTKRIHVMQAYPCGAGIAATQAFIGQRAFKEILFKNGLPWVFVFDGLNGNPDDGTVVVVGDLGAVYERNLCKFRTVLGLTNRVKVNADAQELAKAPADKRDAIMKRMKLDAMLTDGTLTLPNGRGAFSLYDFYGNPVPAKGGKITVPLNGFGYFLRTNGKKGTFAKLLDAVRTAHVAGYEPVELTATDMVPRDKAPSTITLTITNVLNRKIGGTLTVEVDGVVLDVPKQQLALAPFETKVIALTVMNVKQRDDNTYLLTAAFDAGKDGRVQLNEQAHANLVSHRTVVVDGKLDDWKGVLPHIVKSSGSSPNITETAWLPMVKFPDKTGVGFAVGYLAYDANYFYFAAKVADTTPNGGEIRYATRNDDDYYYPAVSYRMVNGKPVEMKWPEGVRRYSYRTWPDCPGGGDGVSLAFNVLPAEKKDFLTHTPGTMPGYQVYKDTDYEYYLHAVNAKNGGGTEVWRMMAPGVPRKHFNPRAPKAERDGGPVDGAKLVFTQESTQRLVECALPWGEIPDVKAAIDAGGTLKFSFRVSDDKGPSYESAADRSISKWNNLAFHNYWETHWANEVTFAFEK
jgi:hypothetical protein